MSVASGADVQNDIGTMADSTKTSTRSFEPSHSSWEDMDNVPGSKDSSPQPDLSPKKLESENNLGGPTFFPPLYQQRYCFIQQTLKEKKCKHVVDLGSAECTIIRWMVDVPSLEKIQLVDLDRQTLEANKWRIKPWTFDYLQKRERPLEVEILYGSATRPDSRLRGCDVVTMVEFIEHLVDLDLKDVVFAVFATLRPKIVVMTTPNYEFNQLFPGPIRFRHWDHKFEWTRPQFESWCKEICERYEYQVEFAGIGSPPDTEMHCGYCSQVGVFTRNSISDVSQKDLTSCYERIAESVFPHKDKVELDPDTSFGYELQYSINILSRDPALMSDNGDIHIPLNNLFNFKKVANYCQNNVQSLRMYLEKNGYSVQADCVVIPDPEDNPQEESLEDYGGIEDIC
ncbi:hypothetical protein FSP39_017580 [Pinctada imbricata]|uniref:Small RNA 2'-O-methyltransferase n=1 Tax=Pinctada imbricata TaxID=66713 RepID=A0AA88Y7A7_PINIB|nr:hypothetical protein FSP39_017580 [Pinctada imbricata]